MHAQASDRVYYVHQTLADAEEAVSSSEASNDVPDKGSTDSQGIVDAVEAALCDDLNTPQAIALLSEPLKNLNDLLHTKKVRRIFQDSHSDSKLQCISLSMSQCDNDMQGKKAKGRVEGIKSLHRAIKSSLDMMGLDAVDSSKLLQDLRIAALSRSALQPSHRQCIACSYEICQTQTMHYHPSQVDDLT